MSFLIHNGAFIPASGFAVDNNNRAFCYGDGLFESIKVGNGIPLQLSFHLQRIAHGMKALKMDFPFPYTEAYFREQIGTLLTRQGIANAMLKIILYRNAGGLYAPETLDASYIIAATPVESAAYVMNDKGLNLGVFADIEKPVNIFSAFKNNNSLLYVMAGIYAKENGFDDCLIINAHQHLVESINSNLFIVKEGVFYTPTLQSGCINGVMRTVVLQILADNKLYAHEVDLLPADLLQADEIFITNASRGIRWVGAFKHKRYYKTKSTWLVEKLNRHLQITI